MPSGCSPHTSPRRGLGVLAAFLLAALALAALARAASPTPAGTAADAAGLSAELVAPSRLARTQLSPEARALAKALPRMAKRVDSLRQPAATTEEQLGIAFGQIQQMTALAYDPHYLPALVAVGRAYVAARGTDPLTGTMVDPEYGGLGRELTGSAAALHRAAGHSAQLSRTVRSLTAKLAAERRRSTQLATALDRLRRAGSRR
jgi:hypothetical protein